VRFDGCFVDNGRTHAWIRQDVLPKLLKKPVIVSDTADPCSRRCERTSVLKSGFRAPPEEPDPPSRCLPLIPPTGVCTRDNFSLVARGILSGSGLDCQDDEKRRAWELWPVKPQWNILYILSSVYPCITTWLTRYIQNSLPGFRPFRSPACTPSYTTSTALPSCTHALEYIAISTGEQIDLIIGISK